jgi:predicted aspartyl protease
VGPTFYHALIRESVLRRLPLFIQTQLAQVRRDQPFEELARVVKQLNDSEEYKRWLKGQKSTKAQDTDLVSVEAIATRGGKQQGRSRFQGKCYYCKKEGHVEKNCFKKQRDEKESQQVNLVRVSSINAKQIMVTVVLENNTSVKSLLDTGANASFVRPGVIQPSMVVRHGECEMVCETADGGSFVVRSYLVAKVKLLGRWIVARFLVSDQIQHPMLFGMDHLEDQMDEDQGRLSLVSKSSMMLDDTPSKVNGIPGKDSRIIDSLAASEMAIPPLVAVSEAAEGASFSPPAGRVQLFSAKSEDPDLGVDRFSTHLESLVAEFADVFVDKLGEADVGTSKLAPFRVVLKDGARPVYVRDYERSPAQEEVWRRSNDELIQLGILEKVVPGSVSRGWNAPSLLVPKGGTGEWRHCHNYGAVNDATLKEYGPIPNPLGIIRRATKYVVHSKIDLKDFYRQIMVDPASRHILAVETQYGQYQPVGAPFGASNLPVHCHSEMQRIMSVLPNVDVLLDDLHVGSGSFQDHLNDLRKVFEILRANHLRVSKKKCVFGRLELDMFGFTVRHGSFKP